LLAIAPDIVHFEFGSHAAHRLDLKDVTDARVVVSFRGFDVNYYGLDQPHFYDEVWRRADGLHFLGDDLLERARVRGMHSKAPTVKIPPAVDGELFRPQTRDSARAGSATRPLRVLSVGRLHWKKGYEFALDALRRLDRDGVAWEYRIAGSGPFSEAIEAYLADHGLEDRVRLLGAIDRSCVRAEMQYADVFLHAAVSEGFCNAALEAQAMELPVVCSDADGLRECVDDGGSGIVVPRRDAAALARALARLAADPLRRAAMGAAGRSRVTRCFRIEDQIAAFVAFYERVSTAPRR
jgi:colanic acid/amylovoran biosynthesis glycosyltransferase